MIHQVNRLPIANRLLPDVMALQMAVLEAAAQVPVDKPVDLDKFKEALTPILTTNLGSKRRFRGREAKVAQWINAKTETLVKPLSEFAGGAPPDKARFVADIKSDILLLYRPQTASFRVAVLDRSNKWEIGAKDFLYAFYDLWSKGFTKDLLSTSYSGNKYTRQDFVQEFHAKNPNLFICAICDGGAYSTKTEAQIHTSVDHFFPRSIYPHLSCHPLNLIPICSNCNSYIKGDANPLVLNGQPVGLIDFVLPYQKQDTAFREKTYVAVVKRDPRPDKQQHPMRLVLKPARDYPAGKRIDTFNNLYKVDERWSEGLDVIEDQVFRRVAQFLGLVDTVSLTSDPKAFTRYLEALMSQTDLENLGKDPYAFPLVWLLRSYLDDLEKSGEESAIYKVFKAWAQINRDRWLTLQKRSSEISARRPL